MIRFDCHAHVYEKRAAISGARYIPKMPAPLARWLEHQGRHSLEGGVIVQVSFLGEDNSELCAALEKLDPRRFAGVAVVALDVSEGELNRLWQAGVRGIRWNLVRGAQIPDLSAPATRSFFQKLRDRGLHLELHLEGPRLATVLDQLTDQGVPLVVDHFGLPAEARPASDPMIGAVSCLSDHSNLYFKFSAHYRTPFDLKPHAETLLALLPDHHIIWGSDWPHTQHEGQTSYADTHRALKQWCGWSDATAAKALYGIKAV